MSDIETAPDYIPEHIQTLHLDEARERLRHAAAPRLEVVDDDNPVVAGGDHARPRTGFAQPSAVAAVLIGLPGAIALTTVWAWLAVTRPTPVWWSLTALGAALSLVGLVSAVRIGLAVRNSRSQPVDLVPAEPAPADSVSSLRDAA